MTVYTYDEWHERDQHDEWHEHDQRDVEYDVWCMMIDVVHDEYINIMYVMARMYLIDECNG